MYLLAVFETARRNNDHKTGSSLSRSAKLRPRLLVSATYYLSSRSSQTDAVFSSVFQQFLSSCSHFSSDLHRTSGHEVGYDSSIVSHYGDLYNADGSLSTVSFLYRLILKSSDSSFYQYDLGFSGSDVGKSVVVPSGSNWNSATSPASVGNAFNAAVSAASNS